MYESRIKISLKFVPKGPINSSSPGQNYAEGIFLNQNI